MTTARILGLYDENIYYHWTYKEWSNRIKGAKLAIIDAHELAVHAAYVGASVSREERPKPLKNYYDAKAERNRVLEGEKPQAKKADFTLYDKLKESMKTFDWKAALNKKSKK